MKLGLTGQGIVIPDEDAVALEGRFQDLVDEMGPRSERALMELERVALFDIRLRRSAEHEAKATGYRMRHAIEEFDKARMAEVDHAYEWIAADPAAHTRTLKRSPEGIDRLLGAIQELYHELTHPQESRWDWLRYDRLHFLLGIRTHDVPTTRVRALSEAINGKFAELRECDGQGLEPRERKRWAYDELCALIQKEIADLKALRDAFDHEGLARDRAEAPARAMFDDSKASILARKYEASNERAFYKALKEFDAIQAATPEVLSKLEVTPEQSEELGSFFPEPPEESDETLDADPTEPGGGGGSPKSAEKPGLNRRARRKRLAEARSKRR